MSGDVQPRKRKDKRRKKEDVVGQEEVPIPPIVPPQVNEDFNIHVHNDHGTGGGLCAKLVFFILLSALAIFIGSAITQNRGLTDLDTPASESRFANIFSGWIDESINTHDDDHHAVVDFEDKHGDEHDDDDEHQLSDEAHHASEEDAHGSEEDAHGSEEDAHGSEEDTHGSEEENHVSEEDEEEDEKEHVDDDQQVSDEEEQNDSDDDHDDYDEEQLREQDQAGTEEDEQEDDTQEDNENQISDEEHNDDEQHDEDNDDDDQQDVEQHDDDDNEEQQDDDDDQHDEENQIDEQDQETNESNETDDIEDNDNVQDDGSNEETTDQKDDQDEIENEQSNEDNNVDNDVMDESENVSEAPSNLDDTPEESMQEDTFTSKEQEIVEEDSTEANIEDFGEEEVTDNTAGEEEIEKEEIVPELEEDNSSRNAVWTYVTVGVKFGVGVALVVVAHIVLVRKWRSGQQNPNKSAEEEVNVEMSRRNTIIPVSTPDQLEQEIQNAEDEYSEEEELEEESEEEIITPTHRYMQFRTDYSRPSSAEDIVKQRIESVQNAEPSVKYYYKNTDQLKQTDDNNDDDNEEEEEEEELQEDDVEEIDDGDCEAENLEIEGDDVEGEEHEEIETGGDDVKNEEDVEGDDVEEDESEEISDVDDDELLKKLEARYGKISNARYNNIDEHEYDDVDVEDKYDSKKSAKISDTASLTKEKNVLKTDDKLRKKLKSAENSLTDNVELALSLYTNLMEKLPNNAEVKYGRARALDRLAETKRSNELLQNAISSYYDLLQNSTISNEIFAYVGMRCIDLIRFSGAYSRAIYAHKKLIDRFPNESKYLNELAVTLLTSNRLTEAKRVLQKVLARWPENGFAQVHYGFILKINENDLSGAIKYLQAGIKTKDPGVIDGRFYFHLGDALIRLGRTTEAIKVYEDGVEQKVFLSKYQRSLYNMNRLTAKPWWSTSDTPYSHLFHILEANWKIIRDEGVALLNEQKYFTEEKEDLRDTGKWAQFELFVRGFKLLNNCKKCPETCKIIDSFPDARDCKRGQVKFSVMHPGTHVWPHCGPTNSRLRAHLGLMIPSGTYIRVAEEIRYWKEGVVTLFDDSFEHEVWHNGSDIRLVLIIDVWHPELTDSEKRLLPPI